MTHLTPDEFVDLMDGTLDADRGRHAEACETCRGRAAEAREAAALAREVEAPEPSPLFWEHFSARVRDAVAAAPARPGRWAWLTSPAFALAGACAVAALSVVVVFFRSPATPVPPDVVVAEATAADDWLVDGVGDDGAWEFLVALTANLAWEDASEAGLTMRPGTVDRALLSLTPDERSALARLLEEEIADHM